MHASRGFSLVDLMIVIAILAIFFSFIIVSSFRFYRASQVDRAVSEIIALLARAQSQTIAGLNGQSYKIHVVSNEVNLQTQSGVTLEVYKPDINIILVPPAVDITFTKANGKSNGGTITVKTVDQTIQKLIIIDTLGNITKQ